MTAYLYIVLLPLAGFFWPFSLNVLEILFKKRINAIYGGLGTLAGVFCSFALSLSLLFAHIFSAVGSVELKLGAWISTVTEVHYVNELFVSWGLLFDSITLVMLLVITFVSLLVQLYSLEYMSHDLARNRFMGYLSLFVFFMLVLVTANNYLQAFIGWEGVGLVSYLLINFWFTRVEASKSALKAVSVNKFGDFGFVAAMVLMFFYANSFEYSTLFLASDLLSSLGTELFFDITATTFIAFFLLVAAVGKSAQLGLHTWLPDAMEGPTPVSALIHAATMVTAGIYLVVRSSPIFSQSPSISGLAIFLGGSTALFGASVAFFQNDIKKIVAYSTCSQLGYMFLACGLGAYAAAMFHLFTHAFFKALLFLGAGSVIHGLGDEQDLRKMGGLASMLPFTYATFAIGSFSLMGLPFLSGYFSKDLIIELAFSNLSILGQYGYVCVVLAALFTSAYSTRLLYLVFLTRVNAPRQITRNIHEPDFAMTYPLVFLLVLSLAAGAVFSPIFFSDSYWGNSIHLGVRLLERADDFHQIAPFFKLLPTVLVVLAVALVGAAYHLDYGHLAGKYIFHSAILRAVYLFFNKKWFFDHFYSLFFVRSMYSFTYAWGYRVYERGLLAGLLVDLPINLSLYIAGGIKKIHSGFIYHYIALVFLTFFLTFLYYLN